MREVARVSGAMFKEFRARRELAAADGLYFAQLDEGARRRAVRACWAHTRRARVGRAGAAGARKFAADGSK